MPLEAQLRHVILLLSVALVAAGCGSSSATPPAPVIASARYKDARFGFSFRYPSNWTIAKGGGRVISVGGVQTYIIDVSIPQNNAQISVTVDGDVVPFPAFQDGKTAPDPNGPTHTFQYYHAHVAGWPAMVIQRFTSKQITEVDTVTNTRSRSYDVRKLTISPPFSPDVNQGYNQIVKTLAVPFS